MCARLLRLVFLGWHGPKPGGNMINDGKIPENHEDRASDDRALSERLQRLSSSLDLKQKEIQRHETETEQAAGRSENFAKAFRVTADLVGGVLVGGFLGWALDSWLGTRPFGLAILLILGFCAGVLTMLRTLGVVKKAKWAKLQDENTPSHDGKDVS
jgi:ATP synthase protein I